MSAGRSHPSRPASTRSRPCRRATCRAIGPSGPSSSNWKPGTTRLGLVPRTCSATSERGTTSSASSNRLYRAPRSRNLRDRELPARTVGHRVALRPARWRAQRTDRRPVGEHASAAARPVDRAGRVHAGDCRGRPGEGGGRGAAWCAAAAGAGGARRAVPGLGLRDGAARTRHLVGGGSGRVGPPTPPPGTRWPTVWRSALKATARTVSTRSLIAADEITDRELEQFFWYRSTNPPDPFATPEPALVALWQTDALRRAWLQADNEQRDGVDGPVPVIDPDVVAEGHVRSNDTEDTAHRIWSQRRSWIQGSAPRDRRRPRPAEDAGRLRHRPWPMPA